MEKTKVKLNICGSDYTIISDENEEYVKDIAQKVDNKISEVLEQNTKISMATAAVLVALDYCDDFSKVQKREDSLKEKINKQSEELKACREQNEKAKQEINNLLNQSENLYKQIDKDKKEIEQLKEKCQMGFKETVNDVITESNLKDEVASF